MPSGAQRKLTMLERLYVDNFRCLQDFEFRPGDSHSVLLIGGNGTGKSTVAHVLRILQRIAWGAIGVAEIVTRDDFAFGREDARMRIELDVCLEGRRHAYALVLENDRHGGVRIAEERLDTDGQAVLRRKDHLLDVRSAGSPMSDPVTLFSNAFALSAVANHPDQPGRPLSKWLGRMLLLEPVPQHMIGSALLPVRHPAADGHDIVAWLVELSTRHPSIDTDICEHLRAIMPDLVGFTLLQGPDHRRRLRLDFQREEGDSASLAFELLSPGEKSYFLCAVVLAASRIEGPMLTFWDEPDNHLSLSEVRHFVVGLRRAFQSGGQIFMTSHDAAAIRSFSDETTWLFERRSHLEPTSLRRLADVRIRGDLILALTTGELNDEKLNDEEFDE